MKIPRKQYLFLFFFLARSVVRLNKASLKLATAYVTGHGQFMKHLTTVGLLPTTIYHWSANLLTQDIRGFMRVREVEEYASIRYKILQLVKFTGVGWF